MLQLVIYSLNSVEYTYMYTSWKKGFSSVKESVSDPSIFQKKTGTHLSEPNTAANNISEGNRINKDGPSVGDTHFTKIKRTKGTSRS